MEPKLAHGTKTKIEFLAIATLKFRACDSGSEGRGLGYCDCAKPKDARRNAKRATRNMDSSQTSHPPKTHKYNMLASVH